jgi:hypothetical protein
MREDSSPQTEKEPRRDIIFREIWPGAQRKHNLKPARAIADHQNVEDVKRA